MPRRNYLLPAAALAGLVLFTGFLIHLLLLRYERGDVYPGYSTLRADPLGTRAFYEALGSMPGYTVTRGFTSLRRELREKPDALFFLGLNAGQIAGFTKEDVAELDDFVKDGGRVVMTFAPRDPGSKDDEDDDDPWKKVSDKTKKTVVPPAKKDEAKPEAKSAPPEDKDAAPKTEQEKYERDEFRDEREAEKKDHPDRSTDGPLEQYQRSLAALWGFGWDIHVDEKKKTDDLSYKSASKPVAEKPEVFANHLYEGDVEEAVPWKSALYFVRLEPQWQRIYDAKMEPVLVRRKWGRGEIVLATDSYFISDEALRNDRRPRLLAFVTGAPGHIVFDETHLGTEEQEGVMYLAEKFRLQGYLLGMFVVVLLFLWRNSVPLVPPRWAGANVALGGAVSGKDSRSGLVNLLRRNIAAGDLLKTSFAEWRRTATAGRSHLEEKASAMQAVVTSAEAGRADIVQSYHQLREINSPRRGKETYATKS
jgi:hypothetical protein